MEETLRTPSLLHHSAVVRRGDVVHRSAGPWSPFVQDLLRHLESVGFDAAPRALGFDGAGREMTSYIDGEFMQPGPWSLEGAAAVGALLRRFHDAVASYTPPAGAVWQPWFARDLGTASIIGHCDVAPWNIVARDGLPVALIDWEFAGPVDPRVELAQACWLNAKLHDDIVAEREGLPPVADRLRQLGTMLDAYGLPAKDRAGFIDLMIHFVVLNTAHEADEANVVPETTDPAVIWALAWRARAAAWMVRHRSALEQAIR